jgi:TetR/AcrR family transcriptional regulator, regulator of cefoperazone and chloramphenicol sensitivity
MGRRYESPVREAQVAETRRSLLDTAAKILEERGFEALTLPELARQVGVSAPTAYRYFRTLDDLLAALLEWLRPKLGMQLERLLGVAPRELHRLALENFPRFEAHAGLIKALMDAPSWNRIRIASKRDRAARGAQVLAAVGEPRSERDRRLASGAIYALASPSTWRWMRETWGLAPDEAREAAAWAMSALVKAYAAGDEISPEPPGPHGSGDRAVETQARRKQ